MLAQRFAKLLFGYDVFVSYAYTDGREYASGLEKELTGRDFSCFFDTEELAYGEQLHASLRRAIEKSKVLILVGTEGALAAPYVAFEVDAALRARKTVLPVDIDRIRERVPDPTLRGLRWLEDFRTEDTRKVPTPLVVAGISSHFHFVRRSTLARWAGASILVALVAAASVAGWQLRLAEQSRQEAMRLDRLAESRKRAELARYLADLAGRSARADPQRSILLAVEAVATARSSEGAWTPAAEQALREALGQIGGSPIRTDAGLRRAALGPKAGRFLATTPEGQLELLEVSQSSPSPSPSVLRRFSSKPMSYDLSGDGRWLAIATHEGTTELWDLVDCVNRKVY